MRWFRLPRFSVAQRIHLSFVLAAALPLLLLASGAYYLVSTRLEQVALDNARELAKSLGMDVFERLQFVTDQMTLIVARGAVDDAVRTGLDGFDLGERVRAFFQVHANGVVNGAVPFSGDEQVVLTRVLGDAAADKPLLFATGPSARRRLFMLVHDADGYLGAELSLRHLWDTAGVAARPERVCVLDVERQPIFCNHADHAAWLAASDSLIARRDEPRPVDHASGEVMLTAAWSLFLKPYYQFERWTVLVGIPRSLAFAAIASFGRVFAGGAVVALLFAFLFGRRLIRSNLEPLDSLGAATRRLAAGEFDYRVQLHTGDEFEQLGQAFDGMAERIGTQFRQLDALGRLDRALQAARSIDEAIGIAARVLDEMLGETRCALVCHERWQTPGEVWCVGFSSDRVETCSAPEARVPVLDLAASVGIAPRDPAGRADPDATPVRHPVIETEVVAALIVVRDANHDREIVGRVADVLGIALSNLAMERRLFHQANHDWLSGLPNRTSLRDRFITWSGYSQGSRAIGMLLIGLDRFKQVNDSMGHGMGDKLLKAVGWRLRAILPSGAILGRFSGDQFLLMMVDESQRNQEESNELLDIIEHEMLPIYFRRDGGGYSEDWVSLSKASMKSTIPRYNSQRMLRDYVTKLYWPARQQRRKLEANGALIARELAAWKHKVRNAWFGVSMQLMLQPPAHLYHDDRIGLRVRAELNGLQAGDVKLECLVGGDDADGEFVVVQRVELRATGGDERYTEFEMDVVPEIAGLQYYKLRMYPFNEALSHPFELGFMIWI